MRTNCLIFGIRLWWRLRRTWLRHHRAGKVTAMPGLMIRGSYIVGGPFHILVVRGRRDGSKRCVSYKPDCEIKEKPHSTHALAFVGKVMWGDPPHP